MTVGLNKTMSYEFYINTEDGENVWHYDLNKWRNAAEDFINLKENNDFYFEIQITDEEGCEYVEIYPTNDTKLLPKYVQKYVNKVLEKTGEAA